MVSAFPMSLARLDGTLVSKGKEGGGGGAGQTVKRLLY